MKHRYQKLCSATLIAWSTFLSSNSMKLTFRLNGQRSNTSYSLRIITRNKEMFVPLPMKWKERDEFIKNVNFEATDIYVRDFTRILILKKIYSDLHAWKTAAGWQALLFRTQFS